MYRPACADEKLKNSPFSPDEDLQWLNTMISATLEVQEQVNDSPTILVVDDTVTNLILVSSVLEAEGFHTLTASDGPAAR